MRIIFGRRVTRYRARSEEHARLVLRAVEDGGILVESHWWSGRKRMDTVIAVDGHKLLDAVTAEIKDAA